MQNIKKIPPIPAALVAGAFLFYAIQSHLVTEFFVFSLSLIFDKFSVKATGIFPDIALTVCFALLTMGALHAVKNHKSAVIISSLLAASFMIISAGV